MSVKVQLYVYDLSQGLARTLSMQFLGVQLDIVPHTGIVVFGREYFYSGGLQALPKDQFARSHGIPTCEIVELGETEVPRELFEEFVDARRDDYSAAKYDLLTHNCNHFTEEATQFLLGKSIPERIRQVPEIVMRTPMGAMFAQMLEGNRFDPVQGGALGSVGSTAPAGTGAAMSTADILGALGSIAPPMPAAPATPRASEPPTPQAPVAGTPRATVHDGLASGAVSTVPATAMAPRRGGEPRRLSMGPLPTAPSAHGAADETPATSRRSAATPLTRAPQPLAPLATPAPTGASTPGAGTPFVTPAARAPRAPFTYPSMQPLTAKDGPTAPVLANVRAAVKADATMSEERRAAFEADLQAAFDDPNLIDTARAAQIAADVLALLRVWPPAKQFGLLYLTRVLAASSDAVSAALLSVKLPVTLLSARAALELGAPTPAPRAARLMALALVTNLASRSSGVVALVTGSDPERETNVPGLAVVAAAVAALRETSDAALCQMGAALAYNVSLHLRALPAECSELRSKLVAALLGAVLDALPSLTDKEAVGRALSVLGHLWHRPKRPAGDDSAAFEGASASCYSDDVAREEALALALSLDAGAALDRLQERLPELGHVALVADVKALLLE
ncbi:pppde peptidase domain-containing protein [Chrysochromulina tobinii]|uniref:Pppde peptidase domain-containing protein n=1 Tax=Chrysochromulina tobinii TaxID=1460289 RepID=A0A0M0JCN8_9EUKA|nr:pppde peptidase domain-containing protein [Chrysochromulina tobinii]|eukprot:KOO24344.1 pppde peptidase domain-containing protein [Chrysochromulina sp. CCMP291]